MNKMATRNRLEN